MYDIVTVPELASDLPEQLGTKPKFWFRDSNEQQTLFKEGRPNTGENWAEKVACELAGLLGVPHAHYDLAIWRGRVGVVSPSFVPKNGRLILGNELLARMVPGYEGERRFRAKEHTVAKVMAIMRAPDVGVPVGFSSSSRIKTAADVFTGYFMLDALIGNQDRHHENWGLVLSEVGVTLAPTYDHASSLGRNETDEVRIRRITSPDPGYKVERYVERASSAFYGSELPKKPLTTLEALAEAARYTRGAADYWRTRLERISVADCDRILGEVPDSIISVPARAFALRMIEINRTRILNKRTVS
jgi:hypothetical protein